MSPRDLDDEDAVWLLLDDLAIREPVSAAWARRQYADGALTVAIDHRAGLARLCMAELPTIELPLPEWLA